jgi:hypothetical protein
MIIQRSGKPYESTSIDYVVNAPLEMLAAIFEYLMPIILIAQRLISDDEDLATLALASLYGSNSLNEWATMSVFSNLSRLGDDERSR